MYLSTLGYVPNPLLEKYQQTFLCKLRNLWKLKIGEAIPWDEFLLCPDMHVLLFASHSSNGLDSFDQYSILQEKYRAYMNRKNDSELTWDFSQCSVVQEQEKIPGTNIVITLGFTNPDIEKHSHPDHKRDNISITFGSKDPAEWRALFAKAFDILQLVSPDFMYEINSVIRKIIPFDVSEGVHNSWSYSNAIGHLVMSYPVAVEYPELVLLEAILHEYNHNKLNLILQTESLTLNDRREIYYSPYRPDARHIHGIFLGVHAIAWAYWVIWNAHISGIISLPEKWQEKAVLYVLKNWLSLQVIDSHAQLTPLGKNILEEIRSIHRECLIFIKKANISPGIIESAKWSLIGHFNDVKKDYPNILF